MSGSVENISSPENTATIRPPSIHHSKARAISAGVCFCKPKPEETEIDECSHSDRKRETRDMEAFKNRKCRRAKMASGFSIHMGRVSEPHRPLDPEFSY